MCIVHTTQVHSPQLNFRGSSLRSDPWEQINGGKGNFMFHDKNHNGCWRRQRSWSCQVQIFLPAMTFFHSHVGQSQVIQMILVSFTNTCYPLTLKSQWHFCVEHNGKWTTRLHLWRDLWYIFWTSTNNLFHHFRIFRVDFPGDDLGAPILVRV